MWCKTKDIFRNDGLFCIESLYAYTRMSTVTLINLPFIEVVFLYMSSCNGGHAWPLGCRHVSVWAIQVSTLNPKNRGFSEFLAILGCNTHFKTELRLNHSIDQDNLHMKCSALNVDFNGVRFDPLGSRSPYERIKFGNPLENVRFLLMTNLARQWLQIDTDLLLIITSTADELSGGTNIDELERP